MTRRCEITGKGYLSGNKVSHSNRKTKKRSEPNLQWKRFWVPSENRWVRLRVSVAAIRTIDQRGIEAVLAEARALGRADV